METTQTGETGAQLYPWQMSLKSRWRAVKLPSPGHGVALPSQAMPDFLAIGGALGWTPFVAGHAGHHGFVG